MLKEHYWQMHLAADGSTFRRWPPLAVEPAFNAVTEVLRDLLPAERRRVLLAAALIYDVQLQTRETQKEANAAKTLL